MKFIHQERVVDGQDQLDVANVSGTINALLTAGVASGEFLVGRDPQGWIVEAAHERSVDLVEGERVGDLFYTKLFNLLGFVKSEHDTI